MTSSRHHLPGGQGLELSRITDSTRGGWTRLFSNWSLPSHLTTARTGFSLNLIYRLLFNPGSVSLRNISTHCTSPLASLTFSAPPPLATHLTTAVSCVRLSYVLLKRVLFIFIHLFLVFRLRLLHSQFNVFAHVTKMTTCVPQSVTNS